MAPWRCSLGLLVALFLPAAAVAESSATTAQTVGATTGAIAGRLTDPSGGAIKGVTVSLSSDALMGVRVGTTIESGAYRFDALPPGDYVLTFEQVDFQPLTTEAVRVSSGFTATVDATLRVAAVIEAVTVTRLSGVVDRHSTAVAVRFAPAQLANLPAARSAFAILSTTPGVQVARFEVGGNSGDAGGQYGAYGTGGYNRPMVEGISIAAMFGVGFTVDYGAFEEVSVGLGAHGPEWPLPGVQMQFVAKSGGNQYRGSVYADVGHRNWQSHNIDREQRRTPNPGETRLASDANRLWSYHDVNADLGGFIARNRAWWYASAREQDVQIRQVNFPVRPLRTRLTNYTGKATVSVAERHRFVVYAQPATNTQPHRLDPFGPAGGASITASSAIHDADDATSQQRGTGIVWKVGWNAALGERFFAEAGVGQFSGRRPLTPNGRSPRFEDVDSLRVTGGSRHRDELLRRNQVYGSVSYVVDGWAGSHLFRLGGEIHDLLRAERLHAAFPGNVLHVLRNGEPAQVYLFHGTGDSSTGVMAPAAYAGDTWRIAQRLTLNAGVRYDRYRVYLPAQAHRAPDGQVTRFAPVSDVVTWDLFAHRLGGALDLFGDGRTIIKGTTGRYWLSPADLGPNVNPNPAQWRSWHSWRDLNGSTTWDPGEEGNPARASWGGVASESIDPGLRAPWVDEATISLERELPASIGLRTGMNWRREARRYARHNLGRPFDAFTELVPVPDPGPDGVEGTGDDGPEIVAYDAAGPAGPPAHMVRNVAGTGSRHLTWDVEMHRRLRGNWSLAAGLAHTWSVEHASTYSGQAVRQNMFVLSPNDLINTTGDGRHRLRTWTATVSSTIHLPGKFVVSPLLRHQAGQPFGRTISARLPNAGDIRVLAEPVGSRRMDNVTLLDVRIERVIWRLRARQASLFADVFNLLNANPEQNVNWASGPAFLQPITVVAPRIARIGVRLAF